MKNLVVSLSYRARIECPLASSGLLPRAVRPSTLMLPLLVSALTFSTLAALSNPAQAGPRNPNFPSKIKKGERHDVSDDMELPLNQELVLQGGDLAITDINGRYGNLRNNGAIVVKPTDDGTPSRILMEGESYGSGLEGDGSITVEPGATLEIVNRGRSLWRKGRLENRGTLHWISRANPLQGGSRVTIDNYGQFELTARDLELEAAMKKDPELSTNYSKLQTYLQSHYSLEGVRFNNKSGGTISGFGVFSGNMDLSNTTLTPEVPADFRSQPSPSYFTIIGSLNLSNGTMNINMNTNYFGQLSAGGPVTLNGSTLNVTFINGYNGPTSAEQFDIIRCTDIRGPLNPPNFGNFNAAANKFASKTVVAITGGEAYRMTGYVP